MLSKHQVSIRVVCTQIQVIGAFPKYSELVCLFYAQRQRSGGPLSVRAEICAKKVALQILDAKQTIFISS